jgi:dTDP-4-amino-4,6-dideoxygalactose transaminase
LPLIVRGAYYDQFEPAKQPSDCRSCDAFAAEVAGTLHALATSNCGSALHLGLQILGAGSGDEVIVGDLFCM